jgi:hypothetical protein
LPEFEELVLSVRVDDQASAKLEQLKTGIAGLGGGSQAAGFERFKRQAQDLDETIKRFIAQIGEGPRALAEFARGAGAMGGDTCGRQSRQPSRRSLSHWPQSATHTEIHC